MGMDSTEKDRIYEEAVRRIDALLAEETDTISRMSSVCAVLFELLPNASWIGFYRVVAERLLAVGPYQGPVGCLRIRFEQGVCGKAADTGETQIIDDVTSFPGHIACDPGARSEIVVPIRDRGGSLIGVLDLDSHLAAAFDTTDRTYLERVAVRIAP